MSIAPPPRSNFDAIAAGAVIDLEIPSRRTEEWRQGNEEPIPRPLIFAILWIFSRQLHSQNVAIHCLEAADAAAPGRTYRVDIDEEASLDTVSGSMTAAQADAPGYHLVPLALVRARGSSGPERQGGAGPAHVRVEPLDQNHVRLRWAAPGNPADPSQAAAVADFFQKIKLIFGHFEDRRAEPLRRLSLLTEQARGVVANPALPIDGRHFPTIPEVFREVAHRFPGQPAVVHDGRSHDYRQLFSCANRIARHLELSGVRHGEPVLVYGASSFAVIAGFLGVLASGAVLVTLDPALPLKRLRQIIELSDSRFVVMCQASTETTLDLARVLPERRLSIDADFLARLDDLDASADGFGRPIAPNASAYLFFTSGSTGAPKGVLGTHQGLAHFLYWQRSNFPLQPCDRSAQITALSFDVVLRDILYPLTSGACIFIPGRGHIIEPQKILPWFVEKRISILHCVPSLMKAWLLAEPRNQPFASLKYIFFAGEPLTDHLLGAFGACAAPSTKMVNLYGPTETTLAKLFQVVERPVPGVQPIGTAQPGVDVLILRERQFMCGINEVGEIVIRTPYRSKGYYNNDKLTREVFITNPWSDDPQDLLYCTGDLGLALPDGRIQILGRIDNQIKIRGVRIEPNEIETQILKIADVASAVVLARPDDAGEKVLCAFVALREGGTAYAHSRVVTRVREFLLGELPEAMVPRHIVVVQTMPYLPNGKVDRRALLALQDSAVQEQSDAPRAFADSPDAVAVVEAFEKTLGVRVARADQSFVDLGGDSLSFIRLSLALQKLKGQLPEGWEKLSVRAISSLHKTERTAWTPVAVSIPIRFVAIILIVLGHINGDLYVLSPAISLLLVSGYAFANFQVDYISKTGNLRSIVDFVFKVGFPSVLVMLIVQRSTPEFNWSPVFLTANIFLPYSQFADYWYVYVLIQIYVGLLALFSFKWTKEFFLKDPFKASVALMLVSITIAVAYDGEPYRFDVVQNKFWLFCFGMCIAFAKSLRQRAAMLVVAVTAFLIIPKLRAYFPFLPSDRLLSDLFVGNGVAVVAFMVAVALIYFKQVQLPTLLEKPVFYVASSTLFIYLTHFSLRHLVRKFPAVDLSNLFHDFLFLWVAILVGVACWWIYEWCLAMGRRVLFGGVRAESPASGAL